MKTTIRAAGAAAVAATALVLAGCSGGGGLTLVENPEGNYAKFTVDGRNGGTVSVAELWDKMDTGNMLAVCAKPEVPVTFETGGDFKLPGDNETKEGVTVRDDAVVMALPDHANDLIVSFYPNDGDGWIGVSLSENFCK